MGIIFSLKKPAGGPFLGVGHQKVNFGFKSGVKCEYDILNNIKVVFFLFLDIMWFWYLDFDTEKELFVYKQKKTSQN